MIPTEAKQFFSSILVVFKIKLKKLWYTGIDSGFRLRQKPQSPNSRVVTPTPMPWSKPSHLIKHYNVDSVIVLYGEFEIGKKKP